MKYVKITSSDGGADGAGGAGGRPGGAGAKLKRDSCNGVH
jgi:hypothetical protein